MAGADAAPDEPQQQLQGKAGSQPLHLGFGKKLAHTDKVVRDRGFRTLQAWLSKNTDLERLDYLKLWKGLYFAMWMADKRLVQQDLAVKIALLLNDIPREKQGMWVDTFWETMHESWEKLDIHRVNKYMLFVRIVVAEVFKALRVRGWQLEDMRHTAATFTRAVGEAGAGPNVRSMGLQLHFTRLFWDELLPQLAQKPEAPEESLLALLEPLLRLAEGAHSAALLSSIHQDVLRKVPAALAPAVVASCVAGARAARSRRKNQEAFQATVAALREKHQLEAPPEEVPAKEGDAQPKAGGRKAKAAPGKKKKKGASEAPAAEEPTKKEAAAKAESQGLEMSPLMLPRPAIPLKAGREKKGGKGKTIRRPAADAGAASPFAAPAAAAAAPAAAAPNRGAKRKAAVAPKGKAAKRGRAGGR